MYCINIGLRNGGGAGETL